MRSPILIPVVLLSAALSCERAIPTAPSNTTVTTIVTTPSPPTPVTATNPTCPTCPTTCTPTLASPTCGVTGTPPLGVGQRAPEVLFFGADNGRISKYAAAILRWEVSDPAAQVRVDPGVGSVGAVGFVLVFPTQTTTYTLTARNAIATVQRQFTVIVGAES